MQVVMDFRNGYRASVIPWLDELEIAVMHNGEIVYDTPVTDDVVRVSDCDELLETLVAIANLPPRG